DPGFYIVVAISDRLVCVRPVCSATNPQHVAGRFTTAERAVTIDAFGAPVDLVAVGVGDDEVDAVDIAFVRRAVDLGTEKDAVTENCVAAGDVADAKTRDDGAAPAAPARPAARQHHQRR